MTSLRKHLLKSWGDPRFTPAWISGTSQQVGIADICFGVEKQVGEGWVLVETAHATSHGHHEEHHCILEPSVGYTRNWYTYIWCLWKRTSFSMFLHVYAFPEPPYVPQSKLVLKHWTTYFNHHCSEWFVVGSGRTRVETANRILVQKPDQAYAHDQA